jgi:hypothetical protein
MEIDPQEFGELRADVRALFRNDEAQSKTLEHLSNQIDELMSMANRSKGVLWAGMSIAGGIGGALTWLGERLLR